MVRLLALMSTVAVVNGLALGPKSATPVSNKLINAPTISRRQAFTATAAVGLTFLTQATVAPPPAAHAASAGPTKEELERLQIGYKNIQYLLDNFEKETTICRENGGECKRNADAIRKALGLRSTTDPLFQAEKIFAKVKNMGDVDDLEAFFDATEEFNSAISLSNSMSFISQFGEYNPGGGQDQVLKYLNESQKQVIAAQKALKTILDILKLPTD